MKENYLPAKCNTCEKSWEQPVALPMDMSTFVKTIKKLRCSKCGSNKITFIFGDNPLPK